MSTVSTFTLEGLADLDRALAALPTATAKAVVRRVLTQAAQPIDEAWRANAPHLTGALQHSGGVGGRLSRRQAALARKEDDRASLTIYVGPGPDPAAMQNEFGDSHMAAQPFLRPAWEANKDRALKIISTGLAFEIDVTAKRVAAKAARLAAKNAGR